TQPPTQIKIAAMRSLYRWANAIVTPSAGVANYYTHLLNLSPQGVNIIPNPVVDTTVTAQAIAPLNHPWFTPDSPPVILGIGRLAKQKDFPTLIRAFAQLVSQQPARLVILGEGGQRPHLESLIQQLNLQDWVSLPGFVSNPYCYLSRAAVFALSSQQEGLPTVLIEALACGCPVVATDCPSGPRDILEAGQYGLLVPVGDDRALATALQTTLAQPRDAARLKARSQDFAIDRITEQFLNLSHRLLNTRSF
ncbi:MAG: glycosyltransferase, partial [Jaaginema sp. PMC 1078.18]|nr:glycosyltransferase [Jaaginema sp. PMC 1078.18]